MSNLRLIPQSPLDKIAKAEGSVRRAASLEHHRAEFREIAMSKWKQARHTSDERTVELMGEWVSRLSA